MEKYKAAAEDLLINFGHMMTETQKTDLQETVKWAEDNMHEQIRPGMISRLVTETVADICENTNGYNGWWK